MPPWSACRVGSNPCFVGGFVTSPVLGRVVTYLTRCDIRKYLWRATKSYPTWYQDRRFGGTYLCSRGVPGSSTRKLSQVKLQSTTLVTLCISTKILRTLPVRRYLIMFIQRSSRGIESAASLIIIHTNSYVRTSERGSRHFRYAPSWSGARARQNAYTSIPVKVVKSNSIKHH